MTHALIWAAGGTGFTCFMTALGSATVFLFRSRVNRQLHQLLLGFAAGVMIAASMWSLLIPAIEAAQKQRFLCAQWMSPLFTGRITRLQ